jgi:rubrerythrin
MALDLFKERGVPLERQVFTWRELAGTPISKLDDDAFTRVRVILMNGIENEAQSFQHTCARHNADLQLPLATLRRVEHHQQTMINWLLPPDQSVLETTIGYEQVAVEITAIVAQHEPDPYLAQAYRFGLLEDFDHLYRFASLMDRVDGMDANNILQSYTDIRPGRPTSVQHRAPVDDVRSPYDRRAVDPITRLNALTILSAEQQTRNFYMNVGPTFSDPIARQLYAEIASIEEQHVTHYESLIDPSESWLEKWLLHEATEVWCYWSCAQHEQNPRIRAIWERMVSYELGHLHFVMDLFRTLEGRDPAEILPQTLPETISFASQRNFVRSVLNTEVDLRAIGTQFVDKSQEHAGSASVRYRSQLNSAGSPTEIVAAGYRWVPGTELMNKLAAVGVSGRV